MQLHLQAQAEGLHPSTDVYCCSFLGLRKLTCQQVMAQQRHLSCAFDRAAEYMLPSQMGNMGIASMPAYLNLMLEIATYCNKDALTCCLSGPALQFWRTELVLASGGGIERCAVNRPFERQEPSAISVMTCLSGRCQRGH